jgi:hypothetical protein
MRAFLRSVVVCGVCVSTQAIGGPSSNADHVVDGELSADLPNDGRRVRIKSTPGGSGASAVALARHSVIIDGPCNSACAWSFVSNERACFTTRASFGFHIASDPGTGRPMPAVTNMWLDQTRGELAEALRVKFKSSSYVQMSGRQVAVHYPERACK